MSESINTVKSFFETMKEQPLPLALCVMNIGLLGYLYYAGATAAVEHRRDLDLLYENRKYVTDVLASCIHVDQIEKLMKGRQQ